MARGHMIHKPYNIPEAFLDSHNKLVAQVRMLQAKELPPPVATQGRP